MPSPSDPQTRLDPCLICGNDEEWHQLHKPVHRYQTETAYLNKNDAKDKILRQPPGSQPYPQIQDAAEREHHLISHIALGEDDQRTISDGFQRPAGDPILRQALVDAGVLSPDQLEAAWEKIVANSKMVASKMVAAEQRKQHPSNP